tara:strand:- start:44 stop:592 length:549 start_codon:yes stop_codon:yes gene_type:complete
MKLISGITSLAAATMTASMHQSGNRSLKKDDKGDKGDKGSAVGPGPGPSPPVAKSKGKGKKDGGDAGDKGKGKEKGKGKGKKGAKNLKQSAKSGAPKEDGQPKKGAKSSKQGGSPPPPPSTKKSKKGKTKLSSSCPKISSTPQTSTPAPSEKVELQFTVTQRTRGYFLASPTSAPTDAPCEG